MAPNPKPKPEPNKKVEKSLVASSSSHGAAPESAVKLVAAHEESRGPTQKRRQLGRRDTNSQVERVLSSSFAGWTNMATDVKLHEGKTLRDQLTTAIREKKGNQGRLSATFVRELKDQYGSDVDVVSKRLRVNNPSEEVRASLLEAVRRASCTYSTNRSSGPLKQWLATEAAPNQKEMCGLLRCVLDQRPSVSMTHASVVISMATFVKRHSLEARFPAEVEFLRNHLDEALVLLFGEMKKEKMPLESFWSKYRVEASLLLNTVHVDAIMAATGGWTSVAREISATVQGSKLGERMFGFAQAYVVGESLAVVFAQGLEQLTTKPTVDGDDISAARSAMAAKVVELSADDILCGRRTVAMEYLGLKLEVPVKDVYEEVEMRIACIIKSRSVGRKNGLRPLSFENGLLPPRTEDVECGCKEVPTAAASEPCYENQTCLLCGLGPYRGTPRKELVRQGSSITHGRVVAGRRL